MKIRPVFINVLFAAVVVGAFFAALEGAARLAAPLILAESPSTVPSLAEGVIVSDPLLNHKWRPSIRFRDASRGTPVDVTINSQSWVEKYEVSREKPEGVFRVFYVGDSNVQGVVPPEHKMVEIVERELNRLFGGGKMRVEVINTGTSSYSILSYYLLVKERLLAYSPDLVVINVDMTDVPNDAFYRSRAVTDRDGRIVAISPFLDSEKGRYIMTPEGTVRLSFAESVNYRLFRASAFYRMMARAVGRLSGGDAPARAAAWLPWHGKADRSANWLALDWTPEIASHVETSMAVLRDTIALLKERGVGVLVTGVPHYPQYTGEWSPRPHEAIARAVSSSGALFLDSYAALRDRIAGSPAGQYYWESDPTHFNEAGNAVWAEAQLDFLVSHGKELLPGLVSD